MLLAPAGRCSKPSADSRGRVLAVVHRDLEFRVGEKRCSSRRQLPSTETGQTRRTWIPKHRVLLAPIQDQGDRLDRLAETHVVGETRAKPLIDQVVDPGMPAALVRAQLADEAVWLGSILDRARLLEVRGQFLEARPGIDGLERETVQMRGAAKLEAQRFEEADLATFGLRPLFELGQRLAVLR